MAFAKGYRRCLLSSRPLHIINYSNLFPFCQDGQSVLKHDLDTQVTSNIQFSNFGVLGFPYWSVCHLERVPTWGHSTGQCQQHIRQVNVLPGRCNIKVSVDIPADTELASPLVENCIWRQVRGSGAEISGSDEPASNTEKVGIAQQWYDEIDNLAFSEVPEEPTAHESDQKPTDGGYQDQRRVHFTCAVNVSPGTCELVASAALYLKIDSTKNDQGEQKALVKKIIQCQRREEHAGADLLMQNCKDARDRERAAMERTSSSSSAARGAWRDGAVTYLHLLFYIAISSGQIFFNKWVLSSKEINFPYPVALTLLHMVFSSVVCFTITKVFKIVKIEEGMTTDIYISSVIPIGAMFAMTLWLGNSAYLYISVAFAQMLKAIMPVAVFLLGAAFGLEEMSCKMLAIMSVISVGVIVASFGEITISWVGVVYQMGGVVAEALRLIFIEIFLKKKGVRLNLISMMYYVSPCSALCLFIPWLFLEKPKMDESVSWNFPPFTLFLNCMCTFILNLSVFLVISRTSALTARVTGVVRDWTVVLLSAAIFADTQLTFINIIGYAIAIAGVVAYNNHKLKVKPQGNEPQGTDNKVNPGSPQDVETSSISTKEAS
uniref:Sugar phosphate transporter domain-containing protein n=1 Tax=Oryza brachyantha TaxID=4533 RepID=J3MQ56_ORYBR